MKSYLVKVKSKDLMKGKYFCGHITKSRVYYIMCFDGGLFAMCPNCVGKSIPNKTIDIKDVPRLNCKGNHVYLENREREFNATR